MSDFVAKKVYLRGILLHYFIQNKSAPEAHIILVETYSDHNLLETTCRHWFNRFESNYFEVEDKERSGAPNEFENEIWEALFHQDSCQTQV